MEVVERGLAAKFFAVEEESSPPPSRSSSSGCQSGWTLYLDYHSDGGRQRWMLPREGECVDADSMVSDASSGPPRRDDLQFFLGRHQCYSGTGGVVHHGASASDSGSASTSFSQGRRHAKPAAVEDDLDDTASSSAATVYVAPAEESTRCYRE